MTEPLRLKLFENYRFVLYAPFYAAGLVVRYGFYYLIVAPIEVFSRTVAYGARGGVEPPPPPPGDKT